MKNKLRFFVVLIVFFQGSAIAGEVYWEHKDWTTKALGGDIYRYTTNGQIVNGNQFGFLVDKKDCSKGTLWLTISTHEKGLVEYKGQGVSLAVEVDDKESFIIVPLKTVFKFNALMDIALFSDVVPSDQMIQDFKQGRSVSFVITEPEKITTKFDIKKETFSLSGFWAHHLKATDACKKNARGLKAYNLSDFEAARREFIPLANQGNAEVQHYLGYMYENGQGVAQNYKTAIEWYAKAAEGEYIHSQFNLGVFHEYGLGVPQNYKAAIKWYTIAAGRGNASAQLRLGLMFARGNGVPKDNRRAFMWWNSASKNGDPKAIGYLIELSKEMAPEDISEAQDMSKRCFEGGYKNC